ncbi:riboflavin synthase [Methylocella sp.]|uniref:riboflavin synthase n=1 Tax=Methylocella sp. TaxID=1978226 RepID=UPI003C1F3AE0
MFTGLVSDVGEVSSVEPRGALKRVRIMCSYPAESIALGASIACAGPCLTVVGFGVVGNKSWFEVDIGAETLARTTAAGWKPGARLNLERSLKIGDELGGHIVTGHVDGIAEIIAIEDFDGMKRFLIRASGALARFIAEKGSVSLDGTSLTVNSVDGDDFSILLIPHTLQVTTWGEKRPGDAVNLEVDLMARYAARLSETARGVELI